MRKEQPEGRIDDIYRMAILCISNRCASRANQIVQFAASLLKEYVSTMKVHSSCRAKKKSSYLFQFEWQKRGKGAHRDGFTFAKI